MKLNLPKYPLRTKTVKGKAFVFDDFRKKYVAFTPEEYVRQNFAWYLVHEKNYPKGLTAIEQSLKYYDTNKRADIVIYNTNREVVMITECKAPEVNITQKTFDQIARYNRQFESRYLTVTNGLKHYCCEYTESGKYRFLKDIPDYKSIQA